MHPNATGPRRQNAHPDATTGEHQLLLVAVGFPGAVHNPSQLSRGTCPRRRVWSDASIQSETKRKMSDWFCVGSGLPRVSPGLVRGTGSTESMRTIPADAFGRPADLGKDCPRSSNVFSPPSSQNAVLPPLLRAGSPPRPFAEVSMRATPRRARTERKSRQAVEVWIERTQAASEEKHWTDVLSSGFHDCFRRSRFALRVGPTSISEIRDLACSRPILPRAAANWIRLFLLGADDAILLPYAKRLRLDPQRRHPSIQDTCAANWLERFSLRWNQCSLGLLQCPLGFNRIRDRCRGSN